MRVLSIVFGLVCLWTQTGCLSKMVSTTTQQAPPVALRKLSLDQLLARIERFRQIDTMKATVNMRVAYESEDRTKQTRFEDVRGFMLIQKPGSIRVIAQAPVVRSTAFDMASDGEQFQVYLVPKKLFLVGDTESGERSEKRVENVRPQHILHGMLPAPPAGGEKAFLENRAGGQPYQIVTLVRQAGEGELRLTRKFWFDGAKQELTRYQIFTEDGDLATDALYREWSDHEPVPYPERVFIERPLDGYELQIQVLKPGLNEEIPADSFALQPPEGVEIERIGEDGADVKEAKHRGGDD